MKINCNLFQERLYNPELRSGLLFGKLRYDNRKRSEPKQRDSSEFEPDEITNVAELTDFFKKCALPEDKPALMTKLEESAGIRKYFMNKNEKAIFKSSLNLYLVCPELVIICLFVILELKRTLFMNIASIRC